jgi:hypothetical protein
VSDRTGGQRGDRESVVTLTNSSADAPVFMARLTAWDTDGNQILPAYFDDAYPTVMAGESREVTLRYDGSVPGPATVRVEPAGGTAEVATIEGSDQPLPPEDPEPSSPPSQTPSSPATTPSTPSRTTPTPTPSVPTDSSPTPSAPGTTVPGAPAPAPSPSASDPVEDTTNPATAVVAVAAGQTHVALVKGKKVSLKAFGYTASGQRVKVTWTSSNAKVAKVSAKGVVKALKKGKATLSAKAGGKTVRVRVTVFTQKPSAAVGKVTAQSARKLTVGQAVSIKASYSPAKAAGVKVTYKSSKPSIAAVDAAGRLTAKAKGKTVITVKAGQKSKKFTVTVR